MLVSVLLTLVLAGSAPAELSVRAPLPAPSLRTGDSEAQARAELLKGLLALAVWANKSELFAQRDQLWHAVIGLDPDNAEARKGLRYTRDGAGHWKDPPAREVKDRKPALLPELARRRSEIVAAWRSFVLAQLDAEKADAARREKAFAELLALDPDDEIVHGLRGEVRGEKGWRLAESVAAEIRRAELAKCVQEARAAAPVPESCAPAAADLAYLPAWKFACSCEGIHVLLQTSEEEARSLCAAGHAAVALAAAVGGKPLAPSPGFSAYVLVDEGQCDVFARAVADSTEEQHRVWRLAPGFGIPKRAAVALWDKDEKHRLDCFTRHLVANCLYTGFGIDARQGWILDGLGIYLTQQLTGSHATWFRPDRADEDHALRMRLAAETSDWMAEARALVQAGHAPKLEAILTRPLGELKLEEMLLAYAFAAYLVEGEAKALPEILDRIGRGGAAPDTIAAVCARSLPEIEARFLRWIGEIR